MKVIGFLLMAFFLFGAGMVAGVWMQKSYLTPIKDVISGYLPEGQRLTGLTGNDAIGRVSQLLGNANNVDVQVQTDNKTGKTRISFELPTPQIPALPGAAQ